MESKHLELTGRLSTLRDSLNSGLEAQKEQHADAHRSMSEEIALQGRSHATFEERLKVLERCLEDSLERLKEHSQFNASVDSRLVTISDVQKHLGKLEAQLEQGHRSLSGTLDVLHGQVKGDKELRDVHHASTDERLQAIETFIGESGFKVTDHGTRLEVVEGKLLRQHAASTERLKELDDRFNSLEKELGVASEHGTGGVKIERDERVVPHPTMTARLEHLESRIGEATDKQEQHIKELAAANSKLNVVQGHVTAEQEARERYRVTFEERVDFIEKQMGDSTSRQDRHMEDLRAVQTRLDGVHSNAAATKDSHEKHRASVAQRLEFLEKQVGQSTNQYEQQTQDLKGVQTQAAADKALHQLHRATLDERLHTAETKLGDFSDRHEQAAQDLNSTRQQLEDQIKAVLTEHEVFRSLASADKELHEQHHSTVGDRLKNLEQHILKLEQETQDSVCKRLEELEASIGETSEKHGVHAEQVKLFHDKHASIQERIAFIEQQIGDSADRHSAIEAAHATLRDFHAEATGTRRSRQAP